MKSKQINKQKLKTQLFINLKSNIVVFEGRPFVGGFKNILFCSRVQREKIVIGLNRCMSLFQYIATPIRESSFNMTRADEDIETQSLKF